MKTCAVAVLLLTAACATTSGGYLGSDVFEDIPAPKRAIYITRDNESFSYRSRTFRCGRFVYEFQGDQQEVARFYRETMAAPPYSWTFESEDGTGAGSTRLLFRKQDDECRVDVNHVPKLGVERPDNISIIVRLNQVR
jgi:hypothetical protein